ncbi:A-factor-binding protein [Nocardia otitidiscaviarum]|uniref:A-factor-binding protein n=1 Tax=Nocardia otitidiscaviarum TaxID=1823 RepID=A0A378YKS2_9NOCA|nr:TetR/AcrR family transcriptional regulator [Nocardia otitidiscaviarum]SUA77734.1 A-factor-binding protein [Nocardia otitidiscaviarum]
MPEARSVRRQERGRQRMSLILDAALELFGELGYEATSTNAIATRAGVSPGSLYQFFANKEAIAEALSTRLVDAFRAAHASAFDRTDLAELPLDELIDHLLDPLIAFNLAHPGAKALFTNPDMPPALAQGTKPLQDAVLGRAESVITTRFPDLPTTDRRRGALIAVQIVRATMPAIVAATEPERAALIRETKRALRGYLAELARH